MRQFDVLDQHPWPILRHILQAPGDLTSCAIVQLFNCDLALEFLWHLLGTVDECPAQTMVRPTVQCKIEPDFILHENVKF